MAEPLENIEGQETQISNETKQDVFSRDYVETLRKESASYRTKAKDFEAELQKIKADMESKEQVKAAEQGKYKELFEAEKGKALDYEAKLKDLEMKSQELQSYVDKAREQILNDLPKDIKESFGDLSLEKLQILRDKLVTNQKTSNGAGGSLEVAEDTLNIESIAKLSPDKRRGAIRKDILKRYTNK